MAYIHQLTNSKSPILNYIHRKQTPIENSISCPTAAPQNKANAFDSPPPTRRKLDAPPPLIRCKNHIRSSAHDVSEKSSDSDGDEIKTSTKKYNLRRLVGVHEEIDHSRQRRTLRKRTVKETKASELRNVSPTKRTKKSADSCAGPNLEKCSSSTRSRSQSKPYSELNYLESIGSIRTIRRAKNPDINKIPTRTQTATPFVSPESQNGWDRKTKLKISYRVSTTNENDVQFALIIYEPMTMLIRRNLLEEFQKAALEEEQERASSSSIVPLPTTPIDSINRTGLLKTPLDKIKTKIDKPISLRRLRF